jgi:signal transduction histidine kinase
LPNVDTDREGQDPSSDLSNLETMEMAFLTAISHQLRTPLASILGFSLTLLESAEDIDPALRRDMLERIVRNARRLERSIADLTDVDRLSRGLFQVRRSRTDIGLLVRQVVESMPEFALSRLEIQAEVVAVVDGAKVERIVESLISNAMKYTPPATPIRVLARRVDDALLIVVEDEGPGVPEEYRTVIFDAFRQGPGTVTHSPGMGLGLPLVAGFAKLHGGRAWVEATETGGACFKVLLPEAPAGGD